MLTSFGHFGSFVELVFTITNVFNCDTFLCILGWCDQHEAGIVNTSVGRANYSGVINVLL